MRTTSPIWIPVAEKFQITFCSRLQLHSSSVFQDFGAKVSSSLISLWYDAGMKVKSQRVLQPFFPHREPQLFLKLRNIESSDSFEASGFIVIKGSKNASRIIQSQFLGSKSCPKQTLNLMMNTVKMLVSCSTCWWKIWYLHRLMEFSLI